MGNWYNCVGLSVKEHVKRALEVAAAGGHNALMSRPPGSGKTLLARSLPSILPRMTPTEALDVTRISSVADPAAGNIPLIRHRRFHTPRPRHLARGAGRRWPVAAARRDQPGAPRRALPGRNARVRSARAGGPAAAAGGQDRHHRQHAGGSTFPANFMLVGAQNPWPIGASLRATSRHGESIRILRGFPSRSVEFRRCDRCLCPMVVSGSAVPPPSRTLRHQPAPAAALTA